MITAKSEEDEIKSGSFLSSRPTKTLKREFLLRLTGTLLADTKERRTHGPMDYLREGS